MKEERKEKKTAEHIKLVVLWFMNLIF